MKDMNRKVLCGIAAVGVVALVILAYVLSLQPAEPVEETALPETTTTATSGSTKSGTTTSGTLSFTDAYKLYANGYRFEFVNCNATPGSLSVKQGSKFMLDNRDNEAHTIVVGTKSYSLGAYGFTIATASTVGTNHITCDGGGAADLIVQK